MTSLSHPSAPSASESAASSCPAASAILDYLQHALPQYPFDPKLDLPFVQELVGDHPTLDILEEIKVFRWYYDNRPPLGRQARASLRRWIARARRPRA